MNTELTNEMRIALAVAHQRGLNGQIFDAEYTQDHFNHIKAQTGNKDKLSLINKWCDINSRKYAREKEPKLKIA